MKRIGVLTSGGDAPGMNGAIRAVVRSGIYRGMEVYGIKRGYEGLINGEIEKMELSSVANILHQGGTVLKTARSKEFRTDKGIEKSIKMLEKFGIEGLCIIGGDGSFRGALELACRGIAVSCIPGTIDNDLGYTDYTIGFDTAVNTVLSAIGNIRDTSASHERNIIVEVMGRNCGDIAVYAAVTGGAENVLIPEIDFDPNKICKKILEGKNRGKRYSILVKAEGVHIDSFELADMIQERTGEETKLVVLGYLQRGGSPTAADRLLAGRMGAKATELLFSDISPRAIGVAAGEIADFDLREALSKKRECRKDLMELVDMLSI